MDRTIAGDSGTVVVTFPYASGKNGFRPPFGVDFLASRGVSAIHISVYRELIAAAELSPIHAAIQLGLAECLLKMKNAQLLQLSGPLSAAVFVIGRRRGAMGRLADMVDFVSPRWRVCDDVVDRVV